MLLIVNGDERRVPDGCTLRELLEGLELDPDRVAVERNGLIVPRGTYADVALEEGDRLEVVRVVGGGSKDGKERAT